MGSVVRCWRSSFLALMAGVSLLPDVGCASLATLAERRGGDVVTQWTLIGDEYGNGAANWRTLAIMQMAMHDALNAARPLYRRWWPAQIDEPAAAGANPEVAMAAAAAGVLVLLHPDRQADTLAAYAMVLSRYPNDASKSAGETLGSAIARSAVARRSHDGFGNAHDFSGGEGPGRWRPTPNRFQTSPTNESRPFLFSSVTDLPIPPPPMLGSPEYLRQLEETRRWGALHSAVRTREQTMEAFFWAYQTSQRGFVELAVRELGVHPPTHSIWTEAHIMAELTAALADSAIIVWQAKERYSSWRPITALRVSGVDATWEPLVETPPFPEYPSGHAADCYVGAGVLEAELPAFANGPVQYDSSSYMDPLGPPRDATPQISYGMGQHAQAASARPPGGPALHFASLADAATNCSDSRIWAGAHFAAAELESKRLAAIIVARALAATPLLNPRQARSGNE